MKGIREEVRTFEIVLHGSGFNNRLRLETENVKCSMNLKSLDIKELDELSLLIKEAKGKIK